MKILWNENPLRTVVELDETEKKWFREKYKSYYLLEECLYSAHYELTTDFRAEGRTDRERIERAVKDMRIDYLMGDEPGFEEFVTKRAAMFVEELAGEHDGDCVKQACSCSKCFAEDLIGVNTLAGSAGRHYVASYFRTEGATLDSVIEKLRTYEPNWPGYEAHYERWRAEAAGALAWLETYRKEHFS